MLSGRGNNSEINTIMKQNVRVGLEVNTVMQLIHQLCRKCFSVLFHDDTRSLFYVIENHSLFFPFLAHNISWCFIFPFIWCFIFPLQDSKRVYRNTSSQKTSTLPVSKWVKRKSCTYAMLSHLITKAIVLGRRISLLMSVRWQIGSISFVKYPFSFLNRYWKKIDLSNAPWAHQEE